MKLRINVNKKNFTIPSGTGNLSKIIRKDYFVVTNKKDK